MPYEFLELSFFKGYVIQHIPISGKSHSQIVIYFFVELIPHYEEGNNQDEENPSDIITRRFIRV